MLTRWALAAATALTAALFTAVLATLSVRGAWRASPVSQAPPSAPREELVFVDGITAREAPPPESPARATTSPRVRSAMRGPPPAPQPPATDSAASAASGTPARPRAGEETVLRLAPPRAAAAPFARSVPRDPFAPAGPPSAAQRDAVLGALHDSVPALARARVPTRDERDEAMRKASLDARLSPTRTPSGGLAAGVSFSLPIFSAGPSRRERVRDSAAFAENRARLERLAARARARVDSVRRADSIAGRAGASRP